MRDALSKLDKPWHLLGFGFAQSFSFFVALIFIPLAAKWPNDGGLFNGYLISGCLFFSVLVFVLISIFIDIYSNPSALILFCVIGCLGMLVSSLSHSGGLVTLIGFCMLSAGSAFLGLWWGKHWSTLNTDRMAIHLALSSLLSWIILLVLFSLPHLFSCIIASILPILSGIILSTSKDEPKRPSPQPDIEITPPIWKVVTMVIAIPIAYSIIRTFYTGEAFSSYGYNGFAQLFVPILASAILLAAILLCDRKGKSIIQLYRIVISYVLIGFIAALSLPKDSSWIALGLIMLSYSLFDEMTWLMSPTIMIKMGKRTVECFGWGRLVLRCSGFLGVILSCWLLRNAWFEEWAATVICLLATIAIVIAAMNVLTDRDLEQFINPIMIDSEKKSLLAENRLREGCEKISEEYGLSKRETEVLGLLARGRSLSVIEDKLCISNSTARTHSRNIYRKMGIHTKQELIDMVERA